MDEKFKKHYLQVVKTVTDQGENIKRLNNAVMELQVEVGKLKHELLTSGMSNEDKEQFERTFYPENQEEKKEEAPKEQTKLV